MLPIFVHILTLRRFAKLFYKSNTRINEIVFFKSQFFIVVLFCFNNFEYRKSLDNKRGASDADIAGATTPQANPAVPPVLPSLPGESKLPCCIFNFAHLYVRTAPAINQ